MAARERFWGYSKLKHQKIEEWRGIGTIERIKVMEVQKSGIKANDSQA